MDLDRNLRIGLRDRGNEFRTHEVSKRIDGIGRQPVKDVKMKSEVRRELRRQHDAQVGIRGHTGDRSLQEHANERNIVLGLRVAQEAVKEKTPSV
jgi:hypothetical protein